jgi:hypothetical protein
MRLTDVVAAVQRGETVELRPSGHSMEPIIRHRQKVRVAPLMRESAVGDVVLARVRGHLYLHRVNAIRGNQYQIANQRGHVNGWCTRRQVYGLVTVAEE